MMSVAYLQILGGFSFCNVGIVFFFLHYKLKKNSNIQQIPEWIHMKGYEVCFRGL